MASIYEFMYMHKIPIKVIIAEYLKVSVSKEYSVGETVKGLSSNTQGVIGKKINFNSEIRTGAGATIINGWQNETGFLNYSMQKLPDNQYYQNFFQE